MKKTTILMVIAIAALIVSGCKKSESYQEQAARGVRWIFDGYKITADGKDYRGLRYEVFTGASGGNGGSLLGGNGGSAIQIGNGASIRIKIFDSTDVWEESYLRFCLHKLYGSKRIFTFSRPI